MTKKKIICKLLDMRNLFIIICFGLLSFNAGDAWSPGCKYHRNGQCIDLTEYYCDAGNKISYVGCNKTEVCCYPYVTEKPTYKFGEDQCGIPAVNSNARIVGGDLSSIVYAPWMVSLQENSIHVCGGSIISDRWILTAAHCLDSQKGKLTALIGTSKTSTGKSWREASKRHYVSKMIVHSKYNVAKPELGYDIAMLKLTKPITLGTTTQRRICLPSTGDSFINRVCMATGWGDTHETKKGGSPHLRSATLPIVSLSKCKSYEGEVPQGTICAGYHDGGEDTCQGDSGGPLVCRHEKGHWVQAGLVSVGRGCGRERAMGFYTDVAHYRRWIEAVMDHYDN